MRNGINGALSFWSVEEIVGEFGKRARACGTVAEHAVQSRVPSRLVWEQTDTDPSIHPSLASINPSIDVTHFTSHLLTHSLSQSPGPPSPPPAPQNTWTNLFIYYIEDLGGEI